MTSLIITDFDGTLVDTFEANYNAYKEAFESLGLSLSEAKYRECFGYRFDKFMEEVGIEDEKVRDAIRNYKKKVYPDYFDLLKPNVGLIKLIRTFKAQGGKTAVASTAARENLINALVHIGAVEDFDLILSGESVNHGKPNPEIYLKVLEHFQTVPEETLVFEDSSIGCEAALSANIPVIRITNSDLRK